MRIITDRFTLSKLLTVVVVLFFFVVSKISPEALVLDVSNLNRFWVRLAGVLVIIWGAEWFNRGDYQASEDTIPIQRWLPHVLGWFFLLTLLISVIYRLVI